VTGVGAGVAVGYVGASHMSSGAIVASSHAINVSANVSQGVMTGAASEVIHDTVDVSVGRKGMPFVILSFDYSFLLSFYFSFYFSIFLLLYALFLPVSFFLPFTFTFF
jgi:hypothetical protein